jgi:integrase/recombinase XerD
MKYHTRDIREYETYLRRRGFMERSIHDLLWRVRRFFDYIRENSYKEIGTEELLKYWDYLDGRLAYSTLQSRLSALRGYFEYLTREKKRYLSSPAIVLDIPRGEMPLPGGIPTDSDIKKLLAQVDINTHVGIRDMAMLETLYSTAVRARELLGLNLCDVDLPEGTLFVREGKGRKDRVLPLGQKATEALKVYLEKTRPVCETSKSKGALFMSRFGKRLDYPNLMVVLRRYRGKGKIPPHKIRHAAALGMLKNGADIRYIQEFLGHESITTTQIYLRLFPQDLKEAMRKYHPREQKRSA